MKNLNTQTVGELAKVLKVDSAKLTEQLMTDEADATKHVTKISELIPADVELLTPTEKSTLLENNGKTKYNEGALAGKEILIKNVAKEYGLKDVTITEFPKLVSKVIEQEKAKSGIQTDEKVKTLEAEKQALQQTVTGYEAEIAKWKGEVDNVRSSTAIQSQMNTAVMDVNIDAPEAILPGQRAMLVREFNQHHEIKTEDGKQIIYRDGKPLKDNLQNPVPLVQAMKEFAPKYVSLKTSPGGRGEGSSTSTPLNGDIANITNRESLEAYFASKGLKTDSKEALAIYREVKAKNPAFK